MLITSKQNELVRKYASLKEKKFRSQYGLYLVEGEKMVREAIESGQVIENIIGTEKYLSKLGTKDFPVIETTEQVISYISDSVSPEGVLAVLKIPTEKFPTKKSCLILDSISDPGNLGAIFRTAVAASYEDVFLINCTDSYSPKVIRSSKSGIFFINLHECSYEDVLNMDEIDLIIADMHGENVFNFTPPLNFGLIIGNESHGVNELLTKNAKFKVKIPMNAKTESLNAAVSAGILMYQLALARN